MKRNNKPIPNNSAKLSKYANDVFQREFIENPNLNINYISTILKISVKTLLSIFKTASKISYETDMQIPVSVVLMLKEYSINRIIALRKRELISEAKKISVKPKKIKRHRTQKPSVNLKYVGFNSHKVISTKM